LLSENAPSAGETFGDFPWLNGNMCRCINVATQFIPVFPRPDRLCGLVARVLGYRSGGPCSIPGTTRGEKSSGSGTGSTQPREYN
jgi:hypothetical protein